MRVRAFISVNIPLFMSLAAISAGQAHAESPWEVRQQRVSYGDLDLTTRKGIDTLWLRVRRAARDVCTDPNVFRADVDRNCEEQALRAAAQSVEAARHAAAVRIAVQAGRER